MGIPDLLRLLRQKVEDYRQAELLVEDDETDSIPVIGLTDEQVNSSWVVSVEDGIFVVSGDKIEKFARRTNFDQYEGVDRLRDIMRKMGITHELIRQGAKSTSEVRIGEFRLTLTEQ